MPLKLGQSAPEFRLADQIGKIHTLSDYRGQYLLIYFYPKDDTPGCTTEACGFRDLLPKFSESGLTVVGISTDTSKSHEKFAAKYGLSFTLLADVEKKTVEDYGVWGKKKFMGREYMGILRTSFLCNPEGKICKIYEQVKPADHPSEVLRDLLVLHGSAS